MRRKAGREQIVEIRDHLDAIDAEQRPSLQCPRTIPSGAWDRHRDAPQFIDVEPEHDR